MMPIHFCQMRRWLGYVMILLWKVANSPFVSRAGSIATFTPFRVFVPEVEGRFAFNKEKTCPLVFEAFAYTTGCFENEKTTLQYR